jgi:predicted branched-subunit amino acid permease
MSTPASSTQERWRRWGWVAPVLVIMGSLMLALRVVSSVLILLAAIVLGCVLYANARERRRSHDSSHSP